MLALDLLELAESLLKESDPGMVKHQRGALARRLSLGLCLSQRSLGIAKALLRGRHRGRIPGSLIETLPQGEHVALQRGAGP